MIQKQHRYRQTIRHLIDYFKRQEEKTSVQEMDMLWQKINIDIQSQSRLSKTYRLRRMITSVSVAAVLLGIVCIGIYFVLYSRPADLSVIAAQMIKTATNDSTEISLMISADKVITVKKGATVAYSSDGEITIDGEKIIGTHQDETNTYNQLIVPKGKTSRLVLADGSSMHINAGTKVVFPRHFKEDQREIFVDGEIYIDVKHNAAVPFFVKTANFEVEVLGTVFDVNAYSEETLSEVVLVRGLVKIKDHSNKEMHLLPNQLAPIREGKLVGKQNVDTSTYILWTQGLLSCENEPLGRLFRKLHQYYGVPILYDSSVESLQINGNLDLTCSLDEVLRRIALAAPISYHQSASGYIVGKK